MEDTKLEQWINQMKQAKQNNPLKNSYKDYVSELEEKIKYLNNDFKIELIEIFESNDINHFIISLNHFFLLFNTVNYHIELKKFYEESIPFRYGKYFEKLETQNKKSTKTKFIPAPPQDYLKRYKFKCEELLGTTRFFSSSTTARLKIRDRNLLISDLINLITKNNYSKETKYKDNLRNTKKSKEFNQVQDEIIINSLETGKQYFKTKE